jgi:hypothetical protein
MPLRWSPGDQQRDPAAVLERGYFNGARECARVLASGAGDARIVAALAFSSPWPVVENDRWRVAPAVPVVVGESSTEGPDGIYSGRGEAIVREAFGAEGLFIVGADGATDDEPFDVLWFDADARLLVRRGLLEIEDLFCRVTVAATEALLDRLLLRARRLAPDLLHAVGTAAAPAVATVRVRRPQSLVRAPGVLEDPRRYLEARAEASGVTAEGDRFEVKLRTGGQVVFRSAPISGGWSLRREDGNHPWSAIRLTGKGEKLELTVDLDETIDPMAPGMRGRLAFDLQADLVALSQKT